VPLVHSKHAEFPQRNAYVPVEHPRHSVAAEMFAYVPRSQTLHHTSVIAPLNDPGLHWMQKLNPIIENVPNLQFKQVEFDVAPVAVEYVPAGHSVH
jgi:hypothetical protein